MRLCHISKLPLGLHKGFLLQKSNILLNILDSYKEQMKSKSRDQSSWGQTILQNTFSTIHSMPHKHTMIGTSGHKPDRKSIHNGYLIEENPKRSCIFKRTHIHHF